MFIGRKERSTTNQDGSKIVTTYNVYVDEKGTESLVEISSSRSDGFASDIESSDETKRRVMGELYPDGFPE